jgi:hypothetical protein
VQKLALIVLFVAACQGKGDETTQTAPRDAKVVAVADAEAVVEDASVRVEEPEPPDPGKQIADLGAVPAWQAVVDRSQYLERRGQHGVVYGTIGTPVMVLGPTPTLPPDAGVATKLHDAGMIASDYTWLVDDTEGNGALAIRAMFGKHAADLKEGERVALGGAWALDDSRHWYWKVDEVTKLPPAPPSDLKDPPSPPGHDIVVVDRFPAGARTISVARDNDLVYFTVNGKPPAIDGEGWPVSNELGDPVFALLNLPGERASFGAQDFRTPDERWQLRRGWQYAVRIGKIRKNADPLKPASINARTAPIRIK